MVNENPITMLWRTYDNIVNLALWGQQLEMGACRRLVSKFVVKASTDALAPQVKLNGGSGVGLVGGVVSHVAQPHTGAGPWAPAGG